MEDGEKQLIDLVLGRIEESEARELMRHVSSCPECSSILQELREDQASFKHASSKDAQLANSSPIVSPDSAKRWWRMAAAAAIVAALAGVTWKMSRPETLTDRVTDGGVLLALHASGEWTGLSAQDPADRQAVLDALRMHRLPPVIAELRAPASGEIRGTSPPSGLQLVMPVFKSVLSARPEFSWSALPGATSYRVAVYAADMRVLEVSPPLPASQLSWVPAIELPRGVKLGWQVTATTKHGEPVLAPAPPLPPAFFEVASEAQAARLNQALAAKPPSHLLLATMYARLGMAAEARREVELLARDNPESEAVQGLLAGTSK
jgi:hypothetical protein